MSKSDREIDFSYGKISGKTIKEARYSFVMGYISNRLMNIQKYGHTPITQEEFYNILRANGIGDLEI